MISVQALMPKRVGQKVKFSTEDGRPWILIMKSKDSYVIAPAGEISFEKSRWGDERQISHDLRHLAEHGRFPPTPKQRW